MPWTRWPPYYSTGGSMQNRKGFTLIELLIVVVIIGILAAIAIPKFANTKEKAVLAGMKSDLRNLVTAQEGVLQRQPDLRDPAPRRAAQAARCTWPSCPTAEQRDHPVDRDCGRLGGRRRPTPRSRAPSPTCGIYVGSGTAPNGAVTAEGAPACY